MNKSLVLKDSMVKCPCGKVVKDTSKGHQAHLKKDGCAALMLYVKNYRDSDGNEIEYTPRVARSEGDSEFTMGVDVAVPAKTPGNEEEDAGDGLTGAEVIVEEMR